MNYNFRRFSWAAYNVGFALFGQKEFYWALGRKKLLYFDWAIVLLCPHNAKPYSLPASFEKQHMKIFLSITFFLTLVQSLYCQSLKRSTKVNFDKIIFHTSLCFGNCPVYHLEVDSKGHFKLNKELVFRNDSDILFEEDSSEIGYYQGITSDLNYKELNSELEEAKIKSLNFDGSTCCDGSVITIIIYKHGKRIFLQSMFPPESADDLIKVLYSICEQPNLMKTLNDFEIESEKASR